MEQRVLQQSVDRTDIKIGISKIREVAGTDKQGTNAYGVIKAAEQLGFSAKGVKEIKKHFSRSFHYHV